MYRQTASPDRVPRLFIRLHPEGSEVSWLRMGSGSGESITRTGPLSALAGESAGCRVIVFVPGSDVLLLKADVPPMSRQRMSTAVPFSLEDQLAGDVELLHFAFGARSGREPLPVLVTDRARMTAWLSRLEEAGIHPDVLVPEILGLPLSPDAWTVLVEAGMAQVRTGPLSGFFADLPNFPTVLRAALVEAGEHTPAQVQLLHYTENRQQPIPIRVEELLPPGMDCRVTSASCEPDVLSVLSSHFREQDVINLLQGPYARGSDMGRAWRTWRIPALLAVVWFGLWIGILVMDVMALSEQNRSLRSRTEEVYRQTFPDARKMNDLRVRMERALRESGNTNETGTGFLTLLGEVGPYLPTGPNARLTGLDFHSGELKMRLEMAGLQALDQLKERLTREANLTVEVLSATTREGVVTGHLRIAEKR
uniref:Type II secretion system protein L n=1 Tax=Candidatus Kentrum sp. DK TaxID=2126562 RepID=A0A450S267_9GAMM|nr:MAG: general secretion pathway protein L [Candidatus Kentron sp. DK]